MAWVFGLLCAKPCVLLRVGFFRAYRTFIVDNPMRIRFCIIKTTVDDAQHGFALMQAGNGVFAMGITVVLAANPLGAWAVPHLHKRGIGLCA